MILKSHLFRLAASTAMLSLLCRGISLGQNLVPNPSFEDVNSCAEYAQPCSPSAWFFLSRHLTTGYFPQYPSATGSRHLQMVAVNRETVNRQYWETMLLCPLKNGDRYRVSMKVASPATPEALSDRPPNLRDIGLWFTDRFIFVEDDSVLQPRSYLSFQGASTTDLKNGWFEIKKEFVATANSTVLMVGNFARMANADIMEQREVTAATIDVLVDDISVVDVNGGSCGIEGQIKNYLYSYTWRHSEVPILKFPPDTLERRLIDSMARRRGDTLARRDSLARRSGDSLRRRDSLLRRAGDTPRRRVADTIIIHNIQFDFNKYLLQNPDTLKQYSKLLTRPGITRIHVVGYTDNVGSQEYNLDLSLKRAQEVARQLALQFKVDPTLIEAEGKGISADYPTRELNRRVEIYIYHN